MRVLVACEESQRVCNIEEIWVGIPEISNYEVSNLGNVRIKNRVITYSDGRKRAYESKVLKQGMSCGYPFVNLCFDGKIRSVKVHNLVARAFIGENPNRLDICHKNGIKVDNRPENLEYGTRSKNNLDGYKIRGYVHKNQKLSPDIAEEIRECLECGESQRRVARKYGVCKSTIAAIKSRKIYKREGD